MEGKDRRKTCTKLWHKTWSAGPHGGEYDSFAMGYAKYCADTGLYPLLISVWMPKLTAMCIVFVQRRVALQQRLAKSGQNNLKTGLAMQLPYCLRPLNAGSSSHATGPPGRKPMMV